MRNCLALFFKSQALSLADTCAYEQHLRLQSRIEAEQQLLALRSLQHPYEACVYTVQNSAADGAKFHALAIIKEAAVREWPILGDDERSAIFNALIGLLRGEATFVPFVLRELLHVIAVVFKRSWPARSTASAAGGTPADVAAATAENDKRAAEVAAISSELLRQVGDAITSSPGTGLQLCQTLLTEFSATKSSSLALSVDFHILAHKEFEVPSWFE